VKPVLRISWLCFNCRGSPFIVKEKGTFRLASSTPKLPSSEEAGKGSGMIENRWKNEGLPRAPKVAYNYN
jgi:hypothetical protein